MKILRSVYLIINYKTIIVTVLSLITTYICHHWEFTAEFPLSLVSVAIVFPIVFSINSAYQRRERALNCLADLKAHGAALFLASRDWLPEASLAQSIEIRDKLQTLLNAIYQMFLAKRDQALPQEIAVYAVFSSMSSTIKSFRDYGLPSGEASRLNQYLSKMIIAFDNMKVIYHYRTPITLRAYSKGFIYSFPVLFAPYFASTFLTYSPGWLGYIMPILYSFILVSLDNIQDHLEDPYDQIGEDDIKIDTGEYIEMINGGLLSQHQDVPGLPMPSN